MVYGSIERLFRPEPIHYQEALLIAVIGLAVNVVSAFILGQAHHHGHGHGYGEADHGHGHGQADHSHGHGEADHGHGHGQAHDLNLRSAYLHVIADAATSVAAIVALAGRLAVRLVLAGSRDGHLRCDHRGGLG